MNNLILIPSLFICFSTDLNGLIILPHLGQIFPENIPSDTTNPVGIIQDAINNYFRHKAFGKTKLNGEIILIITDGIQDACQAVCEVITNSTHKMEYEKELGISIIELVHDPQSRKFLKSLDDQLQSINAKLGIYNTINLENLEAMSLTDLLIDVIND